MDSHRNRQLAGESTPLKHWIELLSKHIVAVGLILVAIGGAIRLSQAPSEPSSQPVSTRTGLTERDIAIREAERQGQETYSFTTRFIPGVGVMTSPEEYLRQWEQEAQAAPGTQD